MFDSILLGLTTALTLHNLFYCFIGVVLGMVLGVLPGIGTLAAVSLLFPFSFYLEPTTALIMLGGIFYGTAYGGSISSILLNLPGTPSSAVTSIDGYPMARQGRAGIALLMTALSSFVGGSIGIILMMVCSPLIVSATAHFGSAEYFAMMLMGLIAASSISSGPPSKSIAMIVLGIIFGTVGMDMYTGLERFTFGIHALSSGVNIVAVALGLFGLSEIISSVSRSHLMTIDTGKLTFRSMVPTRDDTRRFWMPTLRGTGIGSFFGALPGTGGAIAAFVSYSIEKRVAKDPSRFGKGAIEGVISPEAANNAADQTAFIPTLTLGIPGSATMAIMIGTLMIHGIAPGPSLMTNHPSLFWGVVMSFWVGNLMLLILNVPLIGIWIRLLAIPYRLLYPAIVVFICVCIYYTGGYESGVWAVLFFGVLGYLMRVFEFPAAPLLLGFVLGPLMEEHFRRAMLFARGDLTTFVTEPVSAGFMAATLLILIWAFRPFSRGKQKAAAEAGQKDG